MSFHFKTASGYVTGTPSSKGLIVIQEWWGLNNVRFFFKLKQIKKKADSFAAQLQCLAVAPDLYIKH